jgi:hypothetical protein
MKSGNEFRTFRPGAFAAPFLAFCATGCAVSGYHSPTIDVIGSYFPAWMICIVIGLALTLISRLLFMATGVHSHLHPAAIVYPSLMAIFTFVTWLAFFRN